MDFLKKPSGHIILLTCVILACYLHTLNAPWYLDDSNNIVTNPVLRSLVESLYDLFRNRGLAYFTFAVNYAISGLDVTSYHLTNIFIHISASIAVYFLLKFIWQESIWTPLIGTLIFALHPVNTQAVTYIVQRMTSLYGFLMLLSLLCFIKARCTYLNSGKLFEKKHLVYYSLSMTLGFLSGLSKENAVLLPLFFMAFDFFILKRGQKYRFDNLKYILPFFLISLFLVLQQFLSTDSTMGNSARMFLFFETESGQPSIFYGDLNQWRFHYLFTQFIVIWKYVLLFFWPLEQLLDYGHPLVSKLLNVRSLLGLSGIVISLSVAAIMRKRFPVAAFGITWFFLALSLESSIFPLDTMFEHRLYVPGIGLIILTLDLLLARRSGIFKPIHFVPILIALSILTVQRNQLWNNPALFWKDHLEKVPHNFRPANQLSVHLSEKGEYAEALPYAKAAAKAYPTPRLQDALGMLYWHLGQLEEAKENVGMALKALPGRALYNYHYAIILGDMEQYVEALKYSERAANREPQNLQFLTYLGYSQFRLGRPEAYKTMRRVIAVDPQNTLAKEVLQNKRGIETKNVQKGQVQH